MDFLVVLMLLYSKINVPQKNKFGIKNPQKFCLFFCQEDHELGKHYLKLFLNLENQKNKLFYLIDFKSFLR